MVKQDCVFCWIQVNVSTATTLLNFATNSHPHVLWMDIPNSKLAAHVAPHDVQLSKCVQIWVTNDQSSIEMHVTMILPDPLSLV